LTRAARIAAKADFENECRQKIQPGCPEHDLCNDPGLVTTNVSLQWTYRRGVEILRLPGRPLAQYPHQQSAGTHHEGDAA